MLLLSTSGCLIRFIGNVMMAFSTIKDHFSYSKKSHLLVHPNGECHLIFHLLAFIYAFTLVEYLIHSFERLLNG